MEKRVLKLKLMYYAPTAVALLRVLFTMWVFISNPQAMSLRFLQLIPFTVIICYTFMYHKLFSDGVPVITLLAPSILHFLFILVFLEVVQFKPFLVPIALDCVYLAIKSIKASSFPFVLEGAEDDKLEELLSEVEDAQPHS